MKTKHVKILYQLLAVLTLLSGPASSGMAEQVNVAFMYNLSNFNGAIPYNWAVPFVDRVRNEVFVVDSGGMGLAVFNEKGMEIFRFPEREDIGNVRDGAVDESGNILLLTSGKRKSSDAAGPVVLRCNYRGELTEIVEIRDLPPGYSDFSPDRIVYRMERFFLADTERMKIVVADPDGRYRAGYDIGASIRAKGSKKESLDLVGFSVDEGGNIFFTIPVLFRAFRLAHDGKISEFGKPGSLPGSFGIIAGIETDGNGNIFILDTLKCVVNVFDREFRFLGEFGGRGYMPGELIAPKHLTVDGKGRVYVAQAANRGISVFNVKLQ